MKGVILAGGQGTRLRPFTHITNKHLLPIYDKPVIYYAVHKLVSAGIDRIMVVTSPEHQKHFVDILGSGQDFISKKTGKQIQIVYGIQNKPSGIADGLYIAKDYVGDDNCVLYLGDNIIEDDISEQIENFHGGATVFLKEVSDPDRFGVVTMDDSGNIVEIEEKPIAPKSNLAVIGLYIYDNTVFKKMVGQPASDRGEYEITYLNNKYIEEGRLKSAILTKEWFDIGTLDSLLEAGNFMKQKRLLSERVVSLSIFFPCYNDKGTIASMVLEAKKVAESLTPDFEIIVIDDSSTDGSRELLRELQDTVPELKLVFHIENQGYGGALRSGFAAATKNLVFYTDGDAQYDVSELPLLLGKLDDAVDIVNGYKIKRSDPLYRIIIGLVYQYAIKFVFGLKIRDIDCDFRLIRKRVLDNINLHSDTGTICVEMIKKIEQGGFKFAEVGVSHYNRTYGSSQFFTFSRVAKTLYRLTLLWFDLFVRNGRRAEKKNTYD